MNLGNGKPLAGDEKKGFVKRMFTGISANYDVVNSVASLFIDHYWRIKAKRALKPRPGQLILDLCSGTMPLARAVVSRVKARVVCLDISRAMLAQGMAKNGSLSHALYPICGDAENLPFPDNTFDSAMVAFGIRNLGSLENGLTEIYRVVRPGGKTVILEFSRPTLPVFAQVYRLYLKKVLIPIGGALTNDRQAYEYLVDSIYRFYKPEQVQRLIRTVGFENVRKVSLTARCVTLYSCNKCNGFGRSER